MPERSRAPGRLGIALALAALLITILALAIASVRLDSATSDEPAHIAAGIIKLRYGWLSFYRDQPPLWEALAAIPLVTAGADVPRGLPRNLSPFGVGRRVLYGSVSTGAVPSQQHDAATLLFLARLPSIALFLALCLAVYLFVAHQSQSRVWGLFALGLTGFCPNLMAHGRLATVDMAATFFSFAAGALFIEMLAYRKSWTAVALGTTSTAALLSKISTIVLIPFFLAVLGVARVMRLGRYRLSLVRPLSLAAVVAFVAFEVIVLGLARAAYLRACYPGTKLLIVPFVDYLATLNAVRQLYAGGYYHPQFLLGHFSTNGWWYYYPAAFMLKSTIPALLLVAAAAALTIRKRSADFAAVACATFAALFFGFSMASELTIGIRHILPVYPFLYAAVAMTFARLLPPTRLAHALAALAIVWHVAESVMAYPGYVSYFNESIGSMRNADRYLIDSNLDWGQDLRRLDLWCRANRIAAIALVYFGGAIPQRDLSVRVIDGYAAGGPPLPKGWFAVSRHIYRVSFAPGLFPETYEAYLARSHARYVTTIGGSIYVYRVD